jgi:hypothetical protein
MLLTACTSALLCSAPSEGATQPVSHEEGGEGSGGERKEEEGGICKQLIVILTDRIQL